MRASNFVELRLDQLSHAGERSFRKRGSRGRVCENFHAHRIEGGSVPCQSYRTLRLRLKERRFQAADRKATGALESARRCSNQRRSSQERCAYFCSAIAWARCVISLLIDRGRELEQSARAKRSAKSDLRLSS